MPYVLFSKIRNLFSRNTGDREEIETHIDLLASRFAQQGMSAADARKAAQRQFGNARLHQQRLTDMRTFLSLSNLGRDLRLGVRQLLRSPLLAIIAITSLALGIGANTAIFTVAKSVLLDTLPVRDPQELRVLTWTSGPKQVVPPVWGDINRTPNGMESPSFSYPVLEQLRTQTSVFQDIVAFKDINVTATVSNQSELIPAEMISGNAFAALGVQPTLGRAFTKDEDNGQTNVAVISDAYWRHLGSPASILGQTISLNGIPVTVLGVAPKNFDGLTTGTHTQIFFPLTLQPTLLPRPQNGSASLLNNAQSWWLQALIRIKPGVPEARLQSALDVTFRQTALSTIPNVPGIDTLHIALKPGARGIDDLQGPFAQPSYVLLALAGLVLLLACVNLANLLLARAATRQREIATRLALGATKGHILRHVLVESLLLSIAGGVAGLLIGYTGRDAIPHLLSNYQASAPIATHFDMQVFGFNLALSLFTGILLGVIPAWQATRNTTLSDSTRATTAPRGKMVLGKSLVVLQIALSTVLLVGAGLFARTLANLDRIPLGFHSDHLLLFRLNPPSSRYTDAQGFNLYQRLEQNLVAIPGVRAVSVSAIAILGDGHSGGHFHRAGAPLADNPRLQQNFVGPDFFKTMSIPLLRGRTFNDHDTSTSPPVALINEALARKIYPNENPVGQLFDADPEDTPQPVQIIGIVADTRYADLRTPTPPTFYLDYRQQARAGRMVIQLRTASDPVALISQARAVVTALDPDLPLTEVRTMDQQIASTLTSERIFARLTEAFGLLALILAAIGVYGIMAYTVARRTSEIGIRMALGARAGQVLSMILREVSVLALTGIVIGIAAALALARLVQSMLYGLTPADPATLAAASALLLLIALAAGFGPARRAAKVDPTQALRAE